MKLENERQHPVEGVLMEILNEDWKKFLQSIRDENRQSNYRLLKVVGMVKGEAYLDSLKVILKQAGTAHLIRFSNKATGQVFNDKHWAGVGSVHIDQRSTAEGMIMDIYILVKPNKYLWIRKRQ